MTDEPPVILSPAARRSCGSCTMCCKVMGVTELAKPAGNWCPHCVTGKGCKIYDRRPQECRTFNCMWLVDTRFEDDWKPDNSKMVVSTSQSNSIEIRCDPDAPAAWRLPRFYEEIIRIARAVDRHNGSVFVIVGKATTLVTPDREFPLGVIPDDEVIVREKTGTRVTGVRLVKRRM